MITTLEYGKLMSNQFKIVPPIPKETVRAAHAVFGGGNFYILIGERLETILDGIELYFSPGRHDFLKVPGLILALITFFQFMEGLTDTQAIDAFRSRIDWKFALHLSLFPVMLQEKDLCDFRNEIFIGTVNQSQLQALIDRLVALAPSRSSNLQNLTSAELLSFVCLINCLDRAQRAMSQMLEVLAVRFPEWLRKVALPHWYGRYNHAIPRLDVALALGQHRFLVEEIGTDIQRLLAEIDRSGLPDIRDLQDVKELDQIWSQQFNQLPYQNQEVEDQLKLCAMSCNSCPGRFRTMPLSHHSNHA